MTLIISLFFYSQYHDYICLVQGPVDAVKDPVPLILVGTNIHQRNTRGQILEPGKCGSKESERKSYVTFNNGLKMASDIKAQGFFECSAKTRVSKSGLSREKNFPWPFRSGPVTPVRHKAGSARLYYLRIRLEASIFGFRK